MKKSKNIATIVRRKVFSILIIKPKKSYKVITILLIMIVVIGGFFSPPVRSIIIQSHWVLGLVIVLVIIFVDIILCIMLWNMSKDPKVQRSVLEEELSKARMKYMNALIYQNEGDDDTQYLKQLQSKVEEIGRCLNYVK